MAVERAGGGGALVDSASAAPHVSVSLEEAVVSADGSGESRSRRSTSTQLSSLTPNVDSGLPTAMCVDVGRRSFVDVSRRQRRELEAAEHLSTQLS